MFHAAPYEYDPTQFAVSPRLGHTSCITTIDLKEQVREDCDVAKAIHVVRYFYTLLGV